MVFLKELWAKGQHVSLEKSSKKKTSVLVWAPSSKTLQFTLLQFSLYFFYDFQINFNLKFIFRFYIFKPHFLNIDEEALGKLSRLLLRLCPTLKYIFKQSRTTYGKGMLTK